MQGNRIHLADRVRENLIMDGGVAAVVADPLAVRFVVRAQSSQFPGETADQLFGRARNAATETAPRGYHEVETSVVNINDPGGGPQTLDTWYEVAYEKPVEPSELLDELRYALGVEKSASTG
ncbi:MAG TPA: hypothetical protein VH062_21805 [Polyangiaceae bacterium]|nr:hypothetical protein [Polyangiaceae bacterium]